MSIVDTEERDGVLILHIKVPRMDAMQASAFKKELEIFVRMNKEKVVLDLGETEYLDSSSLGVFRKFAVDLSNRGGRLVLCNLNPPVLQLLRVSKLEMLFRIEMDIDAALAAN